MLIASGERPKGGVVDENLRLFGGKYAAFADPVQFDRLVRLAMGGAVISTPLIIFH